MTRARTRRGRKGGNSSAASSANNSGVDDDTDKKANDSEGDEADAEEDAKPVAATRRSRRTRKPTSRALEQSQAPKTTRRGKQQTKEKPATKEEDEDDNEDDNAGINKNATGRKVARRSSRVQGGEQEPKHKRGQRKCPAADEEESDSTDEEENNSKRRSKKSVNKPAGRSIKKRGRKTASKQDPDEESEQDDEADGASGFDKSGDEESEEHEEEEGGEEDEEDAGGSDHEVDEGGGGDDESKSIEDKSGSEREGEPDPASDIEFVEKPTRKRGRPQRKLAKKTEPKSKRPRKGRSAETKEEDHSAEDASVSHMSEDDEKEDQEECDGDKGEDNSEEEQQETDEQEPPKVEFGAADKEDAEPIASDNEARQEKRRGKKNDQGSDEEAAVVEKSGSGEADQAGKGCGGNEGASDVDEEKEENGKVASSDVDMEEINTPDKQEAMSPDKQVEAAASDKQEEIDTPDKQDKAVISEEHTDGDASSDKVVDGDTSGKQVEDVDENQAHIEMEEDILVTENANDGDDKSSVTENAANDVDAETGDRDKKPQPVEVDASDIVKEQDTQDESLENPAIEDAIVAKEAEPTAAGESVDDTQAKKDVSSEKTDENFKSSTSENEEKSHDNEHVSWDATPEQTNSDGVDQKENDQIASDAKEAEFSHNVEPVEKAAAEGDKDETAQANDLPLGNPNRKKGRDPIEPILEHEAGPATKGVAKPVQECVEVAEVGANSVSTTEGEISARTGSDELVLDQIGSKREIVKESEGRDQTLDQLPEDNVNANITIFNSPHEGKDAQLFEGNKKPVNEIGNTEEASARGSPSTRSEDSQFVGYKGSTEVGGEHEKKGVQAMALGTKQAKSEEEGRPSDELNVNEAESCLDRIVVAIDEGTKDAEVKIKDSDVLILRSENTSEKNAAVHDVLRVDDSSQDAYAAVIEIPEDVTTDQVIESVNKEESDFTNGWPSLIVQPSNSGPDISEIDHADIHMGFPKSIIEATHNVAVVGGHSHYLSESMPVEVGGFAESKVEAWAGANIATGTAGAESEAMSRKRKHPMPTEHGQVSTRETFGQTEKKICVLESVYESVTLQSFGVDKVMIDAQLPFIDTPQRCKLDKVKMKLFTAGNQVHRGHGFERMFSDYWRAVATIATGASSGPESERSRKIVRGFLKTKKLRRLHNRFIMELIDRSLQETFPLSELSGPMPKLLRSRVKITRVISVESNQPVEGRPTVPCAPLPPRSGPPSKAGDKVDGESIFMSNLNFLDDSVAYTPIYAENRRAQRAAKAAPTASVSLPGALVIDPFIREAVRTEGMNVSESAVWLLVVAMKEFALSVLLKAMSTKEELERGDLQSRHMTSHQIWSGGTSMETSDTRKSTVVRGSRPEATSSKQGKTIGVSDISNLVANMQVGPALTMGGSMSRLACELCLLAPCDASVGVRSNGLENVKRFLKTSMEAEAIERQRELKMLRAAAAKSPSPAKPTKDADKKDSTLARRQLARPPAMGLGRGAKNLAALRARAVAGTSSPSKQSTASDTQPVASPSPGPDAVSTVKEADQASNAADPASKPPTADVVNDHEEGDREPITAEQQPPITEQTKTQPVVSARRGKGFGAKNLAAMRARFSTPKTTEPTSAAGEASEASDGLAVAAVPRSMQNGSDAPRRSAPIGSSEAPPKTAVSSSNQNASDVPTKNAAAAAPSTQNPSDVPAKDPAAVSAAPSTQNLSDYPPQDESASSVSPKTADAPSDQSAGDRPPAAAAASPSNEQAATPNNDPDGVKQMADVQMDRGEHPQKDPYGAKPGTNDQQDNSEPPQEGSESTKPRTGAQQEKEKSPQEGSDDATLIKGDSKENVEARMNDSDSAILDDEKLKAESAQNPSDGSKPDADDPKEIEEAQSNDPDNSNRADDQEEKERAAQKPSDSAKPEAKEKDEAENKDPTSSSPAEDSEVKDETPQNIGIAKPDSVGQNEEDCAVGAPTEPVDGNGNYSSNEAEAATGVSGDSKETSGATESDEAREESADSETQGGSTSNPAPDPSETDTAKTDANS